MSNTPNSRIMPIQVSLAPGLALGGKTQGSPCPSRYPRSGWRPAPFPRQLLVMLLRNSVGTLRGPGKRSRRQKQRWGLWCGSDVQISSLCSNLSDAGWGGIGSDSRRRLNSKSQPLQDWKIWPLFDSSSPKKAYKKSYWCLSGCVTCVDVISQPDRRKGVELNAAFEEHAGK